jgi:hypothetical protein
MQGACDIVKNGKGVELCALSYGPGQYGCRYTQGQVNYQPCQLEAAASGGLCGQGGEKGISWVDTCTPSTRAAFICSSRETVPDAEAEPPPD